jgi:hypothetical protein
MTLRTPKRPADAHSQAARVIYKLGGVMRTAELLGLNKSTVYRWLYARTKNDGLDGFIPVKQLQKILEIAQREGIIISADDLDPRPAFLRHKTQNMRDTSEYD